MSEDAVKDCVSRLFMVRMRLGEFDPPEMNPYKKLAILHVMINCNTAASYLYFK